MRENAPQAPAGEPIAWVNGDELDNMLDDRIAVISSTPSGGRRTPLYRGPAQGSPERGALTKLAAECHRAKWQFDLNEDYKPTAKVARAMILKAFDELHRIGDVALKLRDASSVPSKQNAGPMVPWELNCKRSVCAAPECDCPAMSSTPDGSAT